MCHRKGVKVLFFHKVGGCKPYFMEKITAFVDVLA
jgi:hypothetical protein